jgi:hypothetical protein
MPLGVEERSNKGKLGNIKWPDETERGRYGRRNLLDAIMRKGSKENIRQAFVRHRRRRKEGSKNGELMVCF